MTWSVFSIGEAQLQSSGCAAYTYLLRGSEPYLRRPFYQFSEQADDNPTSNGATIPEHLRHAAGPGGTIPAFPFLTGHGGYLQIFTHGLTGWRPRVDAFFLDPMLPPQIPQGVMVKGMKWQGGILDVDIQLDNTTITRRRANDPLNDPSGPITVRLGHNNPRPGDYRLSVGESLVVPTRRPDLNSTVVPGNHAQCKATVSDEGSWAPGHYPLSAVDGSNATYWQPSSSDPAGMIVDLEKPMSIRGIHVNWGNVPARTFEVWGTEATKDGEYHRLVGNTSVKISAPWIRKEARIVKIRLGNMTEVDDQSMDDERGMRFVKLIIEGTLGNNKDVGATVAEFAVL